MHPAPFRRLHDVPPHSREDRAAGGTGQVQVATRLALDYEVGALSSLAGRNLILLLALIGMLAPVAGLRRIRAAGFFPSMMPRPPILIRSPAFRCFTSPPN